MSSWRTPGLCPCPCPCSWRTPIPTRSICLHDNLESHVVTVQPPKPVLFLDELSLPYADESLTTTPVDLAPSTSGRHVSISGYSNRSTNVLTSFDVKSRDARTPQWRHSAIELFWLPYFYFRLFALDGISSFDIRARGLTTRFRDVTPSLITLGRHISISGHSAWSVNDATSIDSGSGAAATPTSDVSPARSSPVDDESRDRCDSITSTMTSRTPAGRAAAEDADIVDSLSTAGPSVSVYRQSVAAETFRRCEPTHFHWSSTSAWPRFPPDLEPRLRTSPDLLTASNDPLSLDVYVDLCIGSTETFTTTCDSRKCYRLQPSKSIFIGRVLDLYFSYA